MLQGITFGWLEFRDFESTLIVYIYKLLLHQVNKAVVYLETFGMGAVVKYWSIVIDWHLKSMKKTASMRKMKEEKGVKPFWKDYFFIKGFFFKDPCCW